MSKNKQRHILINYIQTAKYPKRTHEKGYWSNPENLQWDERVEFSLGLKKRDVHTYSIIMNIDEGVVVKNSMSDEKEFLVLYKYYRDHYAQQIDNYLKQTENVFLSQSAPTAN